MKKFIGLILAFGLGVVFSSSMPFAPADEQCGIETTSGFDLGGNYPIAQVEVIENQHGCRFEVVSTPDVGAAAPEYNAVGAALEILGILTWTFDEVTGEVVTPNQTNANLWLEPVYTNDSSVHYFDGEGELIPYASLSTGQQGTAFLKHLVGHMEAQRRGFYVPLQVDSARATAEAAVATDAEMFEEF